MGGSCLRAAEANGITGYGRLVDVHRRPGRHTWGVNGNVQPDGVSQGPIADVVAESLISTPGTAAVTAAIYGSQHAAEIAAQVEAVLSSAGLSDHVVGSLFHVASVGSVTGVVLADGSEVVVKAYQPAWTPEFLSGVHDTQARLWKAGVPCGKPIGGPARCGLGFATIETHVADPGQPETFGDCERTASAEGLALIVESAGLDPRLSAHPLSRPAGALYPQPHSPLFNFEATNDGAEWIDDLARLARSNTQDSATVVAHTDWSARNVRLRADGVCAVYDLDSLATVSLPTALGQAAATWRALGEAQDAIAPDVDEIEDWLDRFPTVLSPLDRRAALAAALWVLCYTARCEHAIDPAEQLHTRARSRLRQDTTRFREAING